MKVWHSVHRVGLRALLGVAARSTIRVALVWLVFAIVILKHAEALAATPVAKLWLEFLSSWFVAAFCLAVWVQTRTDRAGGEGGA